MELEEREWIQTRWRVPRSDFVAETALPEATTPKAEQQREMEQRASKIRRTMMPDTVAVNTHWMHKSPEEWDVNTYDESQRQVLRELVNQNITIASGKRLVDIIGTHSQQWRKGRLNGGFQFNPIATFLTPDDPVPIQQCQRKGFPTTLLRQVSEGFPRD